VSVTSVHNAAITPDAAAQDASSAAASRSAVLAAPSAAGSDEDAENGMFCRGFSALELRALMARARPDSAAVLARNCDLLVSIGSRTWRLLTRRWLPICHGLGTAGVSLGELRGIKHALEYPAHDFSWFLGRIEGPERYHLGGAGALAVDVIWFLTQIEGQTLRSGVQLPRDLLDRYLIACALERASSLGPARIRAMLEAIFGLDDGPGHALDAALAAFLAYRRAGTDEGLGTAGVRRVAVPCSSGTRAARADSPRPLPRPSVAAGLGRHEGTALAAAAALGQRAALLAMLLVGVPLELPLGGLGGERRALARKARWLATFLREKPRTNNTPGSHLACGMIAVKRTLKELSRRRERADAGLRSRGQQRARLTRERNRAARLVYERLGSDPPAAVEHSQREHACNEALERIDGEVLERRLALQASVVNGFVQAWQAELRAGRVEAAQYERALAELRQPPGEAPALLPEGLLRSRAAWLFEYGMFLGRLGFAVAFATTFQSPYLALAVGLALLNLYVVQPVVLQLQLTAMGHCLNGRGHKLADLKRYLQTELPPGATFRVPITVPKFSSNPAWTNLSAIMARALARSLTTEFEIEPLSMRRGQKSAHIDLLGGAESDVPARARALCEALRAELEGQRARFPLETRVSANARRVSVELMEPDDRIWALIGEDASQAFIYLWRNLRALSDTLAHLGETFQPVFILASNTEDPDAIEYELAEIQKLQRFSDREYRGQVGFLYLLRGGQWYDYNSRRERFDPKDRSFVKAAGYFKERLSDPGMPGREYLLRQLVSGLEPRQLADAFNAALDDPEFFAAFDVAQLERLPPHLRPSDETFGLLARRRARERLTPVEQLRLNRELLLTALPLRVRGAFFKKVGNDIAVHELLVAGKTRPTTYVQRQRQEHVQDPTLPNYARVWGDFSRYTGLAGTTQEIQAAILSGADLNVLSVPELGAILDDKNEFAPGELEKGIATLLHPENRHIVIGVPRIDVTLPESRGEPIASQYILSAQVARSAHNQRDGVARAALFSGSTPAYGKWLERPKPYLAHYVQESLNAAQALSHDFQQSYLVAGAGGRLGGFTEALYGPKRFDVRAAPALAAGVRGGWRRLFARWASQGAAA
jgi:hypothetical protein